MSLEDKELFYKRKTILLKQRLEDLEHDLKSTDIESLDEAALHVKLELLEKIYSNFENAHDRLEHEDISEMESTLPDEVSSIYISAKTILKRKIMVLGSKRNLQNPQLVRQSLKDQFSTKLFILPFLIWSCFFK